MKKSLVLLAVLSLSVSCSKVKEVENNMNTMKDTTVKMSDTTDDMKDTTGTMYEQIRSKESEDTRAEKFDILVPDEGFGKRLAAASILFKSFEFQLWTGNNSFDDKNSRDVLLLDAANELTKNLADLYEKINVKKMSPTKTGERHADEQSFYAIAATMHMNHHYQLAMAADKKIEVMSFYDAIKNSLKKDYDGKNLKEYEEVLVSNINKEIMIELIKARVDMLSALALKNLTDKREMTLGQKFKGVLFKVSGGKLGKIDLPEVYDKSNNPTKKQTIKYLDSARKAKDFLLSIGVEKDLEKTVKSGLANIDMNVDLSVDEDATQADQKVDDQRKLIQILITGLLAN